MTQTLSEKLQKAINKALDDGVDLSDSKKRNEFCKKYLKEHPNIKCHRTTFTKAFIRCFKDRKTDLTRVNLSRKKKYNVELAEKMRQEHQSRTEPSPSEQTPDVSVQAPDEIMHELNADSLNVKFTESLFRCAFAPLEAMCPETRIPDETLEQLGQMWHPSIERCGNDKLKHIILPAVATTMLLGTNMLQGYRAKKEKDSQTETE